MYKNHNGFVCKTEDHVSTHLISFFFTKNRIITTPVTNYVNRKDKQNNSITKEEREDFFFLALLKHGTIWCQVCFFIFMFSVGLYSSTVVLYVLLPRQPS